MRKYLTIFAILLFAGSFAQTGTQPAIQALERQLGTSFIKVKDIVGDFTITDTDGNVLNLYTALGEGKTVFVDLFYST
jgi:hypothetical protein